MADFVVIKGGRDEHPMPKTRFIDACITDTRLMGVLGLRVHWSEMFDDDPAPVDVYHFYYYDIEELGLDTLSIYEISDEEGLELATKACFGGLGAKMVGVSEKEAMYLIDLFISETIKKKQELPESADFAAKLLLGRDKSLSADEIYDLNRRMCTRMSGYGLINYYLMRGFGKDEEGVRLLRDRSIPDDSFDDLSMENHATFLKNTINEFYNEEDRTVSFLSESLVESGCSHYIVASDIRIKDGFVISAKKRSCFEISIEEASLLLARSEYCTVYAICCPMEDFDIDFAPFTIGTTKTEHDNGDMFMDFKPDNSHADNRVFRLYDDIRTLYFVSDYGELIIAAYSPEDIKEAEKRIRQSEVKKDVKIMVKMELARSVLFDFAQSDFTHFGAFIKSLE